MMRKALVAALATLALPLALSAQSVGIGVRAGTFGLGGEVSVQLMEKLAVRGGLGIVPVELNGDFGDVTYNIKPTSPLTNVGLNFFPGMGGLHLSAGVLMVPNTTDLTAEYTGTVTIGDRTYTGAEAGTLTGTLDHGSMAPYAGIGFGRMTARGIGLFLDLGAAFMSEPVVTLNASGPGTNSQQFRDDLERERQKAQEDAEKYLRILPQISLGLRFGLM
jgi:hypothetical protein